MPYGCTHLSAANIRPRRALSLVFAMHQSKKKHVDRERLAVFVDRRTRPREAEVIVAHLAACESCRRLIAEVAKSRTLVPDPQVRETPSSRRRILAKAR